MLVKLHSQTRTTPKVRSTIQASDELTWVLADRHKTTEKTDRSGASATALRIAAIRLSYPPKFAH